jgi:hypothetical protein
LRFSIHAFDRSDLEVAPGKVNGPLTLIVNKSLTAGNIQCALIRAVRDQMNSAKRSQMSVANLEAKDDQSSNSKSVDVMREFLVRVFEEAAAAGLTKQQVMRAVLGHARIIGEPSLPRGVELPEVAPELYADRPDKNEDAPTFLNRVWGAYVEAGILFRDDLSRLGDERLLQALHSYANRKGIDSETVLPPSIRSRVDDIVGTWTPEEKSVARLWVWREGNAKRKEAKSR